MFHRISKHKNLGNSDVSLFENISKLETEKERLVSEGNYKEAAVVKQKLVELKSNKKTKKKKTIYNNQEKRSEQLFELYTEEYNNLVETWENKIKEFTEKFEASQQKMEQSHTQKMEEYVEDLMQKYPSLKYSKTYLENKTIEINLAKQDKFK